VNQMTAPGASNLPSRAASWGRLEKSTLPRPTTDVAELH
jgi:hypothetical protein